MTKVAAAANQREIEVIGIVRSHLERLEAAIKCAHCGRMDGRVERVLREFRKWVEGMGFVSAVFPPF